MGRDNLYPASVACYCCHRPLTHVTKKLEGANPFSPTGEPVTVEAWECLNEDCVSYRERRPKPPAPPLSK